MCVQNIMMSVHIDTWAMEGSFSCNNKIDLSIKKLDRMASTLYIICTTWSAIDLHTHKQKSQYLEFIISHYACAENYIIRNRPITFCVKFILLFQTTMYRICTQGTFRIHQVNIFLIEIIFRIVQNFLSEGVAYYGEIYRINFLNRMLFSFFSETTLPVCSSNNNGFTTV